MADSELSQILNTGEILSMKIGGGSSAMKVRPGGQIQSLGNATGWDDVQGDLLSRRLTSGVGKVDYNWDEGTVTFEPDGSWGTRNDIVSMNIQTPHAMKQGSIIYPHIHFQMPANKEYRFELRYRIQLNGQPPATVWNTVIADTVYPQVLNVGCVFDPALSPINQILRFGGITVTGFSTGVQLKLIRSDDEDEDLEAYFCDAHYEIDTQGSGGEYYKFDLTTTTTTTTSTTTTTTTTTT